MAVRLWPSVAVSMGKALERGPAVPTPLVGRGVPGDALCGIDPPSALGIDGGKQLREQIEGWIAEGDLRAVMASQYTQRLGRASAILAAVSLAVWSIRQSWNPWAGADQLAANKDLNEHASNCYRHRDHAAWAFQADSGPKPAPSIPFDSRAGAPAASR